jgi:hypothetical protein
VTAILAVGSANAQSTLSPQSINAISATESSSSESQLVADSSFDPGTAFPAASSAAGAAGSGATGSNNRNGYGETGGGGWTHGIFHNLALEAGAGFNAPIGNDTGLTTYDGSTYGPFITWGGNFTVGGGVHFSNRISLLAEYQFIDDKLPGALIYQLTGGNASGGNAHIWSFTLAPVIDLFPKHTNSIYVTGGGGFYRKVTSATYKAEDSYGYTENVLYGHFSSNQGGVNFGIGLTHRLGGIYGDGKTKLFAEARYLFLDTPPITASNGLGTTELLPVTLGVRW